MDPDGFANYVMARTTRMIKFKAKDLPLFNCPVVYVVLGKNEVLYVGLSSNGLCRVFDLNHHVISKISKDVVSIEVYEAISIEHAKRLEETMIKEFRPKHNNRLMRRWENMRGSSNNIYADDGIEPIPE